MRHPDIIKSKPKMLVISNEKHLTHSSSLMNNSPSLMYFIFDNLSNHPIRTNYQWAVVHISSSTLQPYPTYPSSVTQNFRIKYWWNYSQFHRIYHSIGVFSHIYKWRARISWKGKKITKPFPPPPAEAALWNFNRNSPQVHPTRQRNQHYYKPRFVHSHTLGLRFLCFLLFRFFHS